MSKEKQEAGYGYSPDEVKQSSMNFGLNPGKTFLSKFEWIPNGGEGGAEQEALDIVFIINGVEKSYRQFPVTKGYDSKGNEVKDPNSPEVLAEFKNFNARMSHILHCFQPLDIIKAAFSRPINSFKEYCQIAMSILPKNYKEIPLDIFLQYQWSLREGQERTYLDIPKNMKYGAWLCKSSEGSWETKKVDNPSDSERVALSYVNEEGDIHAFRRNGWFMNSNFATSQQSEKAEQTPTNPNSINTGNTPSVW